MKVRDTSPGRLYALSSKTGCTAVNGTMVVAVPSKGQVVVLALDKKIIINGDDNAKFVEVRWGANAAIGSRPTPSWFSDVLSGIISIVGEDTFDINYIPVENKLFLQFSLDVTNEQIDEVNSFLERVVLPKDLVVEMEWADGLPTSYKRLEYLESTGTQYIDSGRQINQEDYYIDYMANASPGLAFGVNDEYYNRIIGVYQQFDHWVHSWFTNNNETVGIGKNRPINNRYVFYTDSVNSKIHLGDIVANLVFNNICETDLTFCIFAQKHRTVASRQGYVDFNFKGRIYLFKLTKIGGGETMSLIPALDPIGAPCMFDTVSKQPFYNNGRGDFTYPGKETEATTYSLRNRMYGKITEHGIRRLYRVPEGYSSKEEYAAENGFKLIVEPPMPEEGYWEPVWHDREDCIELEWVETELPTEVEHTTSEEELQIEDTENA